MRRVLAHRDFRLLWLSQVGSTVADRLVVVILALYVNDIGTPTDVGIVLAAQTIPFVGLLLFGGVWADRLPRHRVMVVTDLVRGGLHALLAALVLTGTAEIWHLVVIEAVHGAAHAFFRPAYTGLVPQTVPDELLQEAQAVNGLSANLASFGGPALAAALFLTVGAGVAFVIDAVTFGVSALLLLRIRPRERGERATPAPALRELADGWREVRTRPWVWLVIGSSAVAMMVAYSPFQALGPAIAEDRYGESAVFGVVAAVFGVGAVAGSALALRWRPQRPLLAGQLVVVAWPLNYLAYAAGFPVAGMVPFAFASGIGIALFITWWETTLALNVPPHALSRVAAFDWMGSLGLAPIGLLLAGPVAGVLGAPETLAAGAALSLLLMLVLVATPAIREVRRPAPVPVPSSSPWPG